MVMGMDHLKHLVDMLKDLDFQKMTEHTERAMEFAEGSVELQEQILVELRNVNHNLGMLIAAVIGSGGSTVEYPVTPYRPTWGKDTVID